MQKENFNLNDLLQAKAMLTLALSMPINAYDNAYNEFQMCSCSGNCTGGCSNSCDFDCGNCGDN
jgi:hypothetical protein